MFEFWVSYHTPNLYKQQNERKPYLRTEPHFLLA